MARLHAVLLVLALISPLSQAARRLRQEGTTSAYISSLSMAATSQVIEDAVNNNDGITDAVNTSFRNAGATRLTRSGSKVDFDDGTPGPSVQEAGDGADR